MQHLGLTVTKPRVVQKDTALTAMAFFLGNPRGWQMKGWTEVERQKFIRSLKACNNLSPSVIIPHGCYLINLASTDSGILANSRKRIREELTLVSQLGLCFYVLHPGSAPDGTSALQRLTEELKGLCGDFPSVTILLENMTGGNKIGAKLSDLAYLLKHCEVNNLGVCLDTAHCWGEGHAMDRLLDDFDQIIGLQHLKAIHLNDSKATMGSRRDLHENIGKGKISQSFWNKFLTDPRIAHIPTVLETPSNCLDSVRAIASNGQSSLAS